jgi:CspA family cold shock protein
MISTGTVKFLSTERVFAFVTLDEGPDVFIHLSRIAGDHRAGLEVGQRVEVGQAQLTRQ